MQFSSLHLAAPLLRAVTEEGYTVPTPIQMQAIPPIMQGRDMLGCAQTGTGKTAAFALPILHRLLSAPADKSRRGTALARALILSPTRELATQIGDSFATYGRHAALSHTVIFGGVSQFHQVKSMQKGVDVIVATPGRLIDLMQQGLVDLSAVKVFVLDEADRMLDMGFILPIRRIASAVPKPRQTLLFSATMPREIVHLAESLMHDPVRVSVTPVSSAAPKIEQSVYMVPRQQKQALLTHLLLDGAIKRVLVFTRTKHGADKVCKRLNQSGVSATAIHGNKAQNQRTRALDGFRSGRTRVLVATDVAARGLDVDAITHVINFDLPNEPEAYVHRIGRTGRAGATGIAVAFCDGEERSMLRDIEKLLGQRVPAITKLPELPVLPESESSSREREYRPAQRGGPRPAQRGSGGQRSGGGQNRGGYPRSEHAGDARDGGGGGSGHAAAREPSHRPGHTAHPRAAGAPHSGKPAHGHGGGHASGKPAAPNGQPKPMRPFGMAGRGKHGRTGK